MEKVIDESKIGIVVWGRGKVFFGALGLVGLGALVGAGSTYLFVYRHRIAELFRIQSALRNAIEELQRDVGRVQERAGDDQVDQVAASSLGTRRPSALKNRRKNGVRVTFQDGGRSETEDFVTASSDSDYDEDAVLVFRHKKVRGNEAHPGAAGQAGDVANSTDLQQFVTRIDKMFEGTPADQHEAYLLLKTNAEKMRDSCDVWWRYAKAAHMQAGVAASNGDKQAQKSFLEQAFSHAEQALRSNENSSDAHKWYAVTLGSRGEFVPTNEKIQNGFIFKKHIDKAISLNPTDGTLHHLLGRFCYEVSSLSWIERKVASTLFSEPPSSSYEEALSHFQAAERTYRPFIENRLYVAKAYIALRDYKNAAYWLDQASKLPVVTPNDKNAHKLVEELLPSYKRYL